LRSLNQDQVDEDKPFIEIALTFVPQTSLDTCLLDILHHYGGSPMSIVQFTRFKSDNAEEMVQIARLAKKIFEKHGAEFLRLSRFHTGLWAGEWLVTTRYSSWEVYGKVQEALAKDPEFTQLQADGMKIAELQGRNIAVGIDL
jgi:hypothetical protein